MGRQEYEVHAELTGVAWTLDKLARTVEAMTTDTITPAADLSFGESLLELAEVSEMVDAAINGDYRAVMGRDRASHERLMAAIDAELAPTA